MPPFHRQQPAATHQVRVALLARQPVAGRPKQLQWNEEGGQQKLTSQAGRQPNTAPAKELGQLGAGSSLAANDFAPPQAHLVQALVG